MSDTSLNRCMAVAPMMDWTDRHDRYFLRQLSRTVLLYTEMVTCGAILHGDRDRFLRFHPLEHPLALQLGGSDTTDLATCARIAADYGYDEINLNVGCPSDRVQNGRFGACLMADPSLVADCWAAMAEAANLPVTIKSRIGIDDLDSYEHLTQFVQRIAEAGCRVFIIHARKAWLSGLSPKENREIPPLRYDVVYRLKQDFPHLHIVINGGIRSLDEADAHLQQVNGVMIGREAYQNPFLLATVDRRYHGLPDPVPDRHTVVQRMLPYIAEQQAAGVPLKSITRHMLGLFQGQPGARRWRRYLSEHAHQPGADGSVLSRAAELVPMNTNRMETV